MRTIRIFSRHGNSKAWVLRYAIADSKETREEALARYDLLTETESSHILEFKLEICEH